MTAPISATPWDLRSGEKWAIESADMRLGGDHNNEVIVDAQGNVVAYVSGNNDEGGNGQVLSAAPAMAEALKRLVAVFDWGAVHVEAGGKDAITELAESFAQARAALKQAGQS